MPRFEICDVEQGSPEWFALHEMRMTGSHADAIGANGKGLMTYIRLMMCTYFSSAEEPQFCNKAMEDGIRREASAVMLYEYETGNKTEVVGFVKRDDRAGVSPDRFVGHDGLLEVKCPTDKVYFSYLVDRKIDTKYMWQMQMQMLICERSWCDYVVHNPNFDQDLIIQRVTPDGEKVRKLELGLAAGEKEMRRIYPMFSKKAAIPAVPPEAATDNEAQLEIQI